MVNEIWADWGNVTRGQLNTQNKVIAETLDEQKFREYIFKNLIEKHIKIEYSEMLWHQWKRLFIDLPVMWDFKWYKFECFISDKEIEGLQYDKEYKNASFSFNEFEDFNNKIKEYMKACGVRRYRYSNEFFHIIKELFWKELSFRVKDGYYGNEYNNGKFKGNWNDPFSQYKCNLLLKIS